MPLDETARFKKYKARKRDNWTAQRLAFKAYGVEVVWPWLGLFHLVALSLLGPFGWPVVEQLGGLFQVAMFTVIFLWLPLWGLALLDRGHGFGVFIGRVGFFFLGEKAKLKRVARAGRELSITDEELFDRYIRTRPESSR